MAVSRAVDSTSSIRPRLWLYPDPLRQIRIQSWHQQGSVRCAQGRGRLPHHMVKRRCDQESSPRSHIPHHQNTPLVTSTTTWAFPWIFLSAECVVSTWTVTSVTYCSSLVTVVYIQKKLDRVLRYLKGKNKLGLLLPLHQIAPMHLSIQRRVLRCTPGLY